MSKMGDSLNRLFGRGKKSTALAARLESTILAGIEDSEALHTLRRLAAENDPVRAADHANAKSVGGTRIGPGLGGTQVNQFPSEPDLRVGDKSSQVLLSLEARDLVESLPEIDVHELAARSRMVAHSLRRQNKSN